MGACLSNDKLPDNVFIVRNIHDDHRHFPKGIIEVTHIELKYKDARSGDEWVWPLKYLRKYGCDREIFSFEAGRKCPGGEGLYAFSTKKASQLFDMVARNISEGGLEGEGGALSPPEFNHVSHSPISLVPPPVPSPNPPPPPASNPPSHPPSAARLPEYQNMSYQDGAPNGTSAQGASSSPPPLILPKERRPSNASATPSPPPRINYAEVSLPEPSDTTLSAEGKDDEKRVSYSQIDIKQTEDYNRQLLKLQAQAQSAHPLPDLGNAGFKIVTPSGSSTGSGTSSSAHRSMSDGNFALSGADSSRDKHHVKGNGSIPGRSHSHSVSSAPDQSLYQNLMVPAPGPAILEGVESPPSTQVNYMNITPQVSDPTSPLQQTYENLIPGQGVTSPPVGAQFSSPPPMSPPRIAGGQMGVYADLVLPKTSTPKGRCRDNSDDEHHVKLSFLRPNNTPAPREKRSQSSISPPPSDVLIERNRSTTEPSAAPPTVAEELVNYAEMDFAVMAALRKTKAERDEEIRQRTEEGAREEERRKKEEAERSSKKKGKKQKKRDRRNSHQ